MDSRFRHGRTIGRAALKELAAAQERILAMEGDAGGCICKGNWRLIVKECEPLFDETYRDREGNECTFFGVVWASDDFYYGMFRKDTKTVALLSCVGDIEGFGYERIDASIAKEAERG